MTDEKDDTRGSDDSTWDPPSPVRSGPRGHIVGLRPETYIGAKAVDGQGVDIGRIGQVYVDDVTGQPDWVTVNTGLFPTKEQFAPLKGAWMRGDYVVLPFDMALVNDAPGVSDAAYLEPDEQESLYSYYASYLGPPGQANEPGSTDSSFTELADTAGTNARTQKGATSDTTTTSSEKRLDVDIERGEAGRRRLRRYVVLEGRTTTERVSPDEVPTEREVGFGTDQPVTSTEAVPVERVRLGTETVTENQQVTNEVRKQQIGFIEDVASQARRGQSHP